ncbi:MAG: ABC transporter ATP-binding protein, partial [Chloroflexota bacterium]|nr:ABC transporter ATP-binding protein [Chloroflexota bacterium]
MTPTATETRIRQQQINAGAIALDVTGLGKAYGDKWAVKDLSLAVPPGALVALLGPSGCGKTTTLRMIAGLIEPDTGDIRFDGASVAHLPPERRGAVMVFQQPTLFSHLDVAANVGFGLRMRREPRGVIAERVRAALGQVQLSGLERRRIGQLSGGQQQRVALARALVTAPRVLLLDEPLSNLDPSLRDEMRDLIARLHAEQGITTLLVTHDRQEAMTLAERIAFLADG